jgi:hypothetical protein
MPMLLSNHSAEISNGSRDKATSASGPNKQFFFLAMSQFTISICLDHN